jgi:membrane-bound serine protease (ClpP class)
MTPGRMAIGNFPPTFNDGGLARPLPSRHRAGVRRGFFRILALAFGLLSGGFVQAELPEATVESAKVVVIPFRGQIAKPELYILRRGLKEAIEKKVNTIVLDMETPGGQLDVTLEMLKALEKFPGKTITYVNREAISAGAFIAAGTDDIYFAPGGVIGAAAPVLADGADISETMRGKLVSYLKARIRSISEGKGYRGEVISAMIDMDSEFKIGDEVIKDKGELLSLTAQEALKNYGDPPQPLLAAGIEENLGRLLDRVHGAGNYTVEHLQITWSEKLAQYLTSITPLLLGLGMVCLFIEFKTPGFGFFGIAGLTLLGIVFFAQFVAGLSGHEPVIFFLIGVVLVVVELFFFPGVMVLALAGGALMLGSLLWAMTDLWPGEPLRLSGDILLRPLFNLMTGMALAVLLFLAILRFLPRGGLWGKMVLDAAVGGEPLPVGVASSLIGESGVAVTALFPSGQVEIGGRRYEASLAVGFADAGSPVRVTRVAEFGLTVEVLS